jgi:3-oxoacyl-[acyl-carrier-protein] synthase II
MEGVAVTGCGAVSPFGSGVAAFWQGVCGNRPGFVPIRDRRATSGNRIWAAVPEDFAKASALPPSIMRNADRFTQLALVATAEALRDARLEQPPPLETGVLLGSTMGGVPLLSETAAQFEIDHKRVSPKLMALVIPNMAGARIALFCKLHGPQLTISTACASSLDAIGIAAGMIERQEINVAIVGGVETLLNAVVYESLVKSGALSRAPDPALASRPFDVDRDGFIMGEGAAVLVLEHVEHARRRGVTPRARIRGYASVADAYHLTSPEPSGEYEALAMRRALEQAGGGVRIEVLYTHGTGTIVGDAAELHAINRVFADGRAIVATSLKGHMGHAMAASGAFSVIAGVLGFERGLVPHTLGTRRVEPQARFDLILDAPRALEFSGFAANAFGFGGQNASVVVTR